MIDSWCKCVIDKAVPKWHMHNADLTMKRQFGILLIQCDMMYGKVEYRHHLVLPLCCEEGFFNGLHEQVGFPGVERAISLLREIFNWPGMYADTEKWIHNSERGLRRKRKYTW